MYYSADKTPFLALTPGCFEFERQKNQQITIRTVKMGELSLPSGMLVISDPFAMLEKRGNLGILIEPDSHCSKPRSVWSTIVDFNSNEDGKNVHFSKKGYLSIILNETLFQQRKMWQKKQKNDPSIPLSCLRYFHLTEDGLPPPDLKDFDEDNFIGVMVDSGTVSMVDAQNLEMYMPPDESASNWYDSFFNHGVNHSWFDALDNDSPLPSGLADIPLPFDEMRKEKANIVLSESGWGDGHYPVIGEFLVADDPNKKERGIQAQPPQLIALHVDFEIIPKNPDVLIASNFGPR